MSEETPQDESAQVLDQAVERWEDWSKIRAKKPWLPQGGVLSCNYLDVAYWAFAVELHDELCMGLRLPGSAVEVQIEAQEDGSLIPAVNYNIPQSWICPGVAFSGPDPESAVRDHVRLLTEQKTKVAIYNYNKRLEALDAWLTKRNPETEKPSG